ncbi:MAG TPA: hypothetical protein DD671_17955 [Balneolaceae bacterium]|nr:hypothetical protein [Balneola sp.]HBQ61434.1 hypothetical protein [Balneolaceae bacterium]|tara:strand:- start:40374 stop:40685 length:312 start_codon:yes stop_codon:yes gene_type:complete
MLFGLPWYAIVAIVSVAGGLFYAYKEKEMELEGKRMGGARELNELRQVVHNLKSRVENLEAIVTEERSSRSDHNSDGLGDIEIDEEERPSDSDSSSIKNNLRS